MANSIAIFPVQVGWIPCVSSRLSFSVAGRFCDTISKQYYRGGKYLGLYCSQNRNLRDGFFSRPNSFRLSPGLLDEKTDDLYFEFFAHGSKSHSGTFDDIRGFVNIRVGECLFGAKEIDPSDQIFSCSFLLRRNGECILFKGNLSQDVEWDSESTPEDTSKYLTSQCYMFLRDLLHRHKHHEATTDTIIKTHSRSLQPSWRSKICFDLMRYVVKYTSGATPKSYTNSLGTLAYLESFSRVLNEKERGETFAHLNLSSLRSSLVAERDRAAYKTNQRLWISGASLPIFIAFMFYLFPKTYTALSLSIMLAASAILVLLALLYTKIISFPRIKLLVALREITFGTSKRVLGTIMLVITMIFAAIGVTLISFALNV